MDETTIPPRPHTHSGDQATASAQRRRRAPGRRRRIALLVVGAFAALTLAPPASGATAAPGQPTLTDHHPCPGQPGFTCSTLTVPLDYHGQFPGSLKLQVATADNTDAPKGVLLVLPGGPGYAGVPFASAAATILPAVAKNYRLVTLDQRGTGELGAIDCPELQAQVGSSDIMAPSSDAVRECAGVLGSTAQFYSTDQTIADYDQLRRALGADKMTLDAMSYGTFAAERYALRYPSHVNKLVLDSVVPHQATAADSLYLSGMRAEARVLRDACATPPICGFDPADDLAQVIRARDDADGVAIFDTIVAYEFVDPTYRNANPPNFPPGAGDVIGALHAARNGDPTRLDALITILRPGGGVSAQFSSGLHAATLCADQRFPWGSAETPIAIRKQALDITRKTLPDSDTWPYTPGVAVGQGLVRACLDWPAEPPASNSTGELPDVPILLLAGTHDVATPLENAQREAALAPRGILVVVPGAAHLVQANEPGTVGKDAVNAFLDS
jgi:pimeloyl-ACP methyl ester carboxylesterase